MFVTSGNFKHGNPVGPHLTSLQGGLVVSISCFQHSEGESEAIWHYEQPFDAVWPEKPNRKGLDKEDYNQAMKEYKTEMAEYRQQLAGMKKTSKFLQVNFS